MPVPEHVTLVHVQVKPECVEEFTKLTAPNQQGAVKEDGNIRFDVVQQKDDPTKFLLYEVYATEAAAKAHKVSWRYTALKFHIHCKHFKTLAKRDVESDS